MKKTYQNANSNSKYTQPIEKQFFTIKKQNYLFRKNNVETVTVCRIILHFSLEKVWRKGNCLIRNFI